MAYPFQGLGVAVSFPGEIENFRTGKAEIGPSDEAKGGNGEALG
jgi:hypothetical protein